MSVRIGGKHIVTNITINVRNRMKTNVVKSAAAPSVKVNRHETETVTNSTNRNVKRG